VPVSWLRQLWLWFWLRGDQAQVGGSSGSACVRQSDVVHKQLAAVARPDLYNSDAEERAKDGQAKNCSAESQTDNQEDAHHKNDRH
jgi:hypothetical protein